MRQGKASHHARVLPERGRHDVIVYLVGGDRRVLDVVSQQLARPLSHLLHYRERMYITQP